MTFILLPKILGVPMFLSKRKIKIPPKLSVSPTANSTQFAFFGRLLVKKFFVKKVLRGAKKLGSGARFLLRSSFFAPRITFSQRTSLIKRGLEKIEWELNN